MKEVTANILGLERDNCGSRSLYVLGGGECCVLIINIQRLILYHEYQITISSETICIGLFETFQPQPVAVRMNPTVQSLKASTLT